MQTSRFYYAHDILSGRGYNYTTAVQSDINSISKARTLIAPSETIAIELIRHKEDYNLRYEYLIILNLDGCGTISNLAPSESSLLIELGINRGWIPLTRGQDLSCSSGGNTSIGEIDTTDCTFAYMQQRDSDTIYYLNVYPLAQKIDSNESASVYYDLLGKIMDPLNLPLKLYEFKDRSPLSLIVDRAGAFEKVGFSGDVSVKASSAIVRPSGTDMITVRINGHDSKLDNVSEIIPINSSSVSIHEYKGILSGGGSVFIQGFHWINLLSHLMANRLD
jgi:hypothetical protein